MKRDNTMNGSPAAEAAETNLALSWAPGVVFALLRLVAIYAICVTPPPDVAQFASSGVFP